MMVKVRMLVDMGGSWPPKGELHRVEESAGNDLVASERAEPVGGFKAKLTKIANAAEQNES